ncbi:MAG: T9SS type A sorting domain-containing protein [Cytophagaceae bacterium]
MKKCTFFILLFYCLNLNLYAQNLQPGDIIVIGFNLRDPDQFSFVNTVDLIPGKEIFFTDCGWKPDQTFRPGEGIVKYTVPAGGRPKWSVTTFGIDPGFTTSGVSGFFGLSLDGDQIIVYQGSFTAPEFIFALHAYNGSWQEDATNNNTSMLPDALVNGETAVAVNRNSGGFYECVMIPSTKEDLLAEVCNKTNWNISSSRVSLPPPCNFSVLSLNSIHIEAKEIGEHALISINHSGISNDEKYILEKSENGYVFTPLFQIENNTNEFLDSDFRKSSFYRIRIARQSSNDYSIIYLEKSERLQVYPNPIGETVNISLGHKEGTFQIIDSNGIVSEFSQATKSDIEQFIVKIKQGIYILRKTYPDGTYIQTKLVK